MTEFEADDSVDSNALATATSFADTICAMARWHGSECCWNALLNGQRVGRAEIESFYSGAAGTALFLASAYRVTGTVRYKATALAGIRHAIQSAAPSDGVRTGLFSGAGGIGLCATIIASFCDHADSAYAGWELVLDVASRRPRFGNYDLIHGVAGSIPLLNAAARALGRPDLHEHARRLGALLLQTAIRDGFGWTWPRIPNGRAADSPGAAHGPTGIAIALLDLYDTTGERDVARFAIEVICGDIARQRERLNTYATGPITHGESIASWCHGICGTGIAVLRTTLLMPSRTAKALLRELIELLMPVAEQVLNDADVRSRSNNCLCHGVAGLAYLFTKATVLGDMAILDVGRHLTEICVLQDRALDWRTDDPRLRSDDNAGFMVGLAGIGQLLLYLGSSTRLPDPFFPWCFWESTHVKDPSAHSPVRVQDTLLKRRG